MKKRYYHSLDMVLNQLLRPLFENLSSDPAPTKSRFYYNTTFNKVRFHNGSEWVFFIDSTDPRLSDRRDPNAHVLATGSGLGPEHTISGASVGAVLRAISSSNAKFEKLSHSDLLDKGANSHSDIDTHLQDITKHFLINDSGTATNEVFSASKVLQLISTVAQAATGALTFMGGYDPVTNTPAILGGLTVRKNHTYVITAAGNFYSTEVTPGDMIIAQQDGASSVPQWFIVSKDIPAIIDATTAHKGVVLIATDADVITGTDDAKAVTPKQLKAAIAGKADNIIKVTKYFLSEIGAADFTGNTKDLLATHINAASITVDENTIQLFELTGDNLSGSDTVYREVYSLNNRGKGQLIGLTGESFFMLSRDTVDYLNTIFALQSHTHTVSQITDFPTFKTIEGQPIIGAGNIDLDKNSVGLGNVDNTSDLNKPISTATQTALDYLQLNKEDKTQKGAPNGYAPLDEFTKLAAQYLNIVNDLVTGGATALLSAEQGKVLQTQISAINTLLTSDNVNLDTVQELVDAIETLQMSLSSILVNDLTTGGTTKALTAEMGKTLKGLIDGLLAQVTPAPIYKIGQLCIFKNPDNGSNNDYLEPGDTVIGFVGGEFLNSGTYYGGDPMLLSSYVEPIQEPYYNFELIYGNPYSSDLVILTRYNPSAEDFKTFSVSERTVVNESNFSINLSTELSSDSYDTYVKLERFNGTDWIMDYEYLDDYGVFLSSPIYFNNSQKIRFTIEIRQASPAIEFYIRNTSPPASTIGKVNLGSSYVYRDQGNITYDTHLGNVQDSVGATILNSSTDADLIRITYDALLFYYFPDISDFTISAFKINNLVYFYLDIGEEYFMNHDGEATTFTNFSDVRQGDNSLVLYAQVVSDATDEVYTVALFTVVLHPENL